MGVLSNKGEREKINSIALSHKGVLQTHGIYVDDEDKFAIIDVVTDFSVKDKAELLSELQSEFSDVFGGYKIIINFDTNYTD